LRRRQILRPYRLSSKTRRQKKLYAYAVKPGAPLDANRPAGDYTVEINEGTTTLVSSMLLHLFSQSATLLYAVGQASNNPPTLRAER